MHLRIEVLHADADTVESKLGKQGNRFVADFARINFDGVFAVFHHFEMFARGIHQLAHLVVAKESRRTASPVQLFYPLAFAQHGGLHGQFLDHVLHVFLRQAAILGNDLVAGTVKTQCIAKRNMEV